MARMIGGTIAHFTPGGGGATDDPHIRLIIIASGFVLGEGFGSIVGLVARSIGLGPISCWGCGVGGGGYCGGC